MSGIVDGGAWRRQRRSHLRCLLETDLSADERAAVETELHELDEEGGFGRRLSRWWRISRGGPADL